MAAHARLATAFPCTTAASLLLATPAVALIDLRPDPDSVETSLRSEPGAGMTDKQLGFLNWFSVLTKGARDFATAAEAAASPGGYSWEWPWDEEALEPTSQPGFSAPRYQLAFTAYAAALLGAAHTPAHPAQTARILRDATARLLHPTSYSYWAARGYCGRPWKGPCRWTHTAMCQISVALAVALDRPWPPDLLRHRCPDPVFNENVMYSAHLAQAATLYEAFSAEPSLSTEGWHFEGGWPTQDEQQDALSLDLSLLSNATAFEALVDPTGVVEAGEGPLGVMPDPMNASKTGGFPCEPRIVYVVCNQHPSASLRLYASLVASGATPSPSTRDYTSESGKWFETLQTTALRGWVNVPEISEPSFFRAIYLVDHPGSTDPVLNRTLFTALGSPGLDGWALAWMRAWAPRTAEADRFIKQGRANISRNLLWKSLEGSPGDGAFLDDNQVLQMFKLTPSLSTSYALGGLGGWPGDEPAHGRVAQGMRFFEKTMAQAVDTDGDGHPDAYFYNDTDRTFDRDGTIFMVTTANVAVGSVYDDALIERLFDGIITAAALARPHVTNISVALPRIIARRAIFDDPSGILSLSLANTGSGAVRGLLATVMLPGAYRAASATARAPGGGVEALGLRCERDIHAGGALCTLDPVDIAATGDTLIEVHTCLCSTRRLRERRALFGSAPLAPDPPACEDASLDDVQC